MELHQCFMQTDVVADHTPPFPEATHPPCPLSLALFPQLLSPLCLSSRLHR